MMMRLLVLAMVLLVWVTAAFGVSDPRTDVLGVYFDENADSSCLDFLQPATIFSVYLIYTNPSVPAILGFEAGYYMSGNFFEMPFLWPCGIIWTVEPDLDNLYVACGEPFLTSVATPLVQFDYMWLGGGIAEGTIHIEKASGSAEPGNNPHIILPDNSLLEVQAGYPAYILDTCGLPANTVEWGAIKSLYR
jgi:hypothetical protein